MKIKIPYWPLLIVPTLMLYVGGLMNWAVIGANHGYMPVQGFIECEGGVGEQIAAVIAEQAGQGDHIHICMDKNSRLKILADWLFIPGVGTASPGDILEFGYDKLFWPCFYMWGALLVAEFNKKEDEKCPVSIATKTSTCPRLMRSARRTRWSR